MKHKLIKAPVKSEPYDPKMFAENKCPSINQNVNVEVNVEQPENCLTSCFAALGACLGKAAKS